MSLEGRGVSNYDRNKPSYSYTTSTTEFDDALISRGIVTFEQAMIAKGASPLEARRLYNLKYGKNNHDDDDDEPKVVSGSRNTGGSGKKKEKKKAQDVRGTNEDDVSGSDDFDDDDDDDDDDEFLSRYREMRLSELKRDEQERRTRREREEQRSESTHGEVIPITRQDWTREVNDASSQGRWVIINLIVVTNATSAVLSTLHLETCRVIEEATHVLAMKFPRVKFVSIPFTSAIENWPGENLPTMFCYRNGKLVHQLVGVNDFGGLGVNCERLEWILGCLGVVQTELEDEPPRSKFDRVLTNNAGYGSNNDDDYGDEAQCNSERKYGRTTFGGKMMEMATSREDESDGDISD